MDASTAAIVGLAILCKEWLVADEASRAQRSAELISAAEKAAGLVPALAPAAGGLIHAYRADKVRGPGAGPVQTLRGACAAIYARSDYVPPPTWEEKAAAEMAAAADLFRYEFFELPAETAVARFAQRARVGLSTGGDLLRVARELCAWPPPTSERAHELADWIDTAARP